MKKKSTIALLLILILLNGSLYSQISKLNNVATGAVEFVGWNNTGVSKALDIKNDSNTPFDIDFYINNVKLNWY